MQALRNRNYEESGKMWSDLAKLHPLDAAGNAIGAVTDLAAGLVPSAGPALRHAGEIASHGDWSGGLGAATGVVSQFAAPEVLHSVRGRIADTAANAAGLRERMQSAPPTAAPAENLTRAEVFQAAQQHGIDLTNAQAIGTPPLRAIQALGDRALIGGSGLVRRAEANRAGVLDWHDQLKQSLDSRGIAENTESVGRDLRAQAESKFQADKAAVDAAYQQELPPLAARIDDVDPSKVREYSIGELFEKRPDGLLRPVFQSPASMHVLKEGLNPGVLPFQMRRGFTGDRVISAEVLPETGSRAGMDATLATAARLPGHDGAAGLLKTPNGDLPFTYRVVESDHLVTSHDPNTFAIHPDYPAGVQERAYHTSKEAQTRVIQQAQQYDPAFTININPDAVNGPHVISQDGSVLGGNSRAMSTARLYAVGNGDVYRAKLLDDAPVFGIDPKTVAGMKRPVLVRELVEPLETVDDARRLASDLNGDSLERWGLMKEP